ncbi:ubiquitin carrier protein, variant [Thecamonas trahens ATCC 50062]|uniref:Ubiquitin carrier protein n=1 Tax=Thecamonas trahens ATCC 50062 TaxID=461836 RepID=A0A0L0D9P6_THETB|nr:ubiquitin carrier protein [Thecamonas trahens ATCC 50062]XP_013759039.1 ubiquitin carrier protein, variant [Thecamonas trahens ATCC 50062]KNC48023.1 ubiquitin carrier protein, variant [Thecamonas trahens ATCC 50062]KNC48024.1 ubiquitin carrier protein [Thecamonas trahens ATCC 50062]|eukprot:XP_013759038.1 ubiquitin carrier protein [Thecamonas trahens ATCC 50062]
MDKMDPSDDWSYALLEEDNYTQLRGMVLVSTQGSPYEGGVFEVLIDVPVGYPYTPPELHFVTPVFHPYVDAASGAVSLPILGEAWSPAESLSTVLQALHELLVFDGLDDPSLYADQGYEVLNDEAAELWIGEIDAFCARARDATCMHAI